MEIDLFINFKSISNRNWFNKNYFIVVYDYFDNLITTFDFIEDTAKFFNKPLYKILYNLKRGKFITFNHKKYKLIVLKKDDDNDMYGG